MSSIVISSDDRELCEDVGQKTADALGYAYVGQTLLAEVAERHNVKEDKLRRVLDPATARRFSSHTRALLLAYIEAATLDRLLKDEVVCANLGGHLFVHGVSHVLVVRVLTETQARADGRTAKKGGLFRKAWRTQERNRERRARWSVASFGLDEGDPSLHDLVISVGRVDTDKVVDIIKDIAASRKFAAMTYSRKCLEDLALASHVKVALLPLYPDIRVSAAGGAAMVHIKCSQRQKRKLVDGVKELASKTPGVERDHRLRDDRVGERGDAEGRVRLRLQALQAQRHPQGHPEGGRGAGLPARLCLDGRGAGLRLRREHPRPK